MPEAQSKILRTLSSVHYDIGYTLKLPTPLTFRIKDARAVPRAIR